MVANPEGIDPQDHLPAFKALSQNSREYQGHGWGCAWLNMDSTGPDSTWSMYHNINPVWQDPQEFPRTTLFLAHARSAFRDEGIVVENNMPFSDGKYVFLFNGELQGVRIKAEGRIGAEKIFNTIKKFDQGSAFEATERGVMVINKRSRYVRAMNFFLATAEEVQVCSQFSEDPDYFQLRETSYNGTRIICSQPYSWAYSRAYSQTCLEDNPFADANWHTIENNSVHKIVLTES